MSHPPATLIEGADLQVAANRAVVYGTLSRWLIHDLRNPVQALTLVTELIDDEPGPFEGELRKTIRETTAHLTRSLNLLDRVLQIVPSNPSPGPVSLGQILEFLDALLRVHRSAVTLDLSGTRASPPPTVMGVESHLEHALCNLVVNALEAIGNRRQGRVSVTTEVRAGRVTLTVADNGPGLAPAVRDRLFEPFVTTKTERPLAGLGLVVARGLVGRYGGRLEYRPGAGPGACFVVELRGFP